MGVTPACQYLHVPPMNTQLSFLHHYISTQYSGVRPHSSSNLASQLQKMSPGPLPTFKMSWLHLAWLWHNCIEKMCLQTDKHTHTHTHLAKYSKLLLRSFLLQLESWGPHFSAMTRADSWNTYHSVVLKWWNKAKPDWSEQCCMVRIIGLPCLSFCQDAGRGRTETWSD